MQNTGRAYYRICCTLWQGQYRAAMYAAVKSANPNWKPGQKFDTSILDNVTRESVESTLVKNGNRLVRNSIDVSV